MPRRLITREWWHLHGDTVLIAVMIVLLVIGVGRVETLSRARAHDRAEQLARIHDAGCSVDATLRRVISKQPPPNRAFYRRIGFTDEQIDDITDAVAQSKTANLDLLGPRDPTCPPVKETP